MFRQKVSVIFMVTRGVSPASLFSYIIPIVLDLTACYIYWCYFCMLIMAGFDGISELIEEEEILKQATRVQIKERGQCGH